MRDEPQVQILALYGLSSEDQEKCREYVAVAAATPTQVALEVSGGTIVLSLRCSLADQEPIKAERNHV